MAGFVREHAGPFVLSVLLHAAVIGLLAVGFWNIRSKPAPKPQIALEATVVDEAVVQREIQRLDRQERRREEEQRAAEARAEELRREREAEEKRLEELQQQRAREEEAERLRAEQQRQQELERQKAAELEAQRRKEQEAKAEAERKRKAEQEAKAEAERKRKAAQEARERSEREAELKRSMAEEERRTAAVDAGLLAQYVAQIQARVQRAWIRPPTARAGLNCIVYVTQVPGGEVVGVRVGECNGDEYVRQSIEAAVYRASPLPEPSDPALFERNLRLEFKPDE